MTFPVSGVSRAGDNVAHAAVGLSDEAQNLLETASHLGVPNTQTLAQELAKVSDPAKRTELLNELAPSLEGTQAADVSAELNKLGKPATLDETARAGKKDGGIDGELALDLTQMGLDVAGLFDPTPISDGSNTVISLLRGNWLDAGLSAVSIIPYVGDAAKLGKLGKWAETVAKAIDAAKSNPAARAALQPAIDTIKGALDKVPLDKLPDSMRKPLEDLKGKVDEFNKLGKIDYGNIPTQHHARYDRYLARVEGAGGTPLAPDVWMKKAETIWANNRAGNAYEALVRQNLKLTDGKQNIGGFIPDFPVGKEWGVMDIKNVKDITSSPQLEAFYKHAKENKLPFSIVIGPNTQTMSAPLIDKILETGGQVLKMEGKDLVPVTIQAGTRLVL